MSVAQHLGCICVKDNAGAHAGRPFARFAAIVLLTDDEFAALLEAKVIMGIGTEEDDVLEGPCESCSIARGHQAGMFRTHDDRHPAIRGDIVRGMSRHNGARFKPYLSLAINDLDHM